MRKIIGSLGAAILAGGMAVAVAAPAAAVCVPNPGSPAVPAVTEEQANPDFVPAVPDSYNYERTTEWAELPPDDRDWYVYETREVEDVLEWEYTRQVPNPEYDAGQPEIKHEDGLFKLWVAETYKTVPNPAYQEAYTETVPAQGEPTIEIIDQGAWTEEVHHEAEGYTEYKFVHKFDWFHLNPKWKTDPNWNAEGNPHSKGWIRVGERFVETKPAWTEYIEHEATYKTIPNPAYVPEQTIEHPAVGEPTIEVIDVEAHWEFQWFHEGEYPESPWRDTDERQDHVTQEYIAPSGGEEFLTESAWGERYTFSREWIETGETRVVTEGYTEYLFELEILVPGTPAEGDEFIEVVVTPAVPAVEPVVCEDKPAVVPVADDDDDDRNEPFVAETGVDGLADTGFSAGVLGWIAAALGGSGLAFVLASRRRSEV